MTIYLIWLDDKQCLFCADEATLHEGEPEPPPDAKPGGVRGFFSDRLKRWKTRWSDDRTGVLSWMRRGWDWLHSWTRPDEPMLARLWSSPRLLIRHPASLSPGEPAAIWNHYLRGQFHRHLFWMTVNGIITPPSVILAVLPGPNLIGYWFAYRAAHHALASWGIARARRGAIPITLEPTPELDAPMAIDADGKPRHVALEGAVARLEEHLLRSRRLRWSRRGVTIKTRALNPSPAPGAETADDAAAQL